MNVSFRPMHFDDVHKIAELEKIIFTDPWTYQQFLAELNDPVYQYPIVLEVNGEMTGYAMIWAFLEEVHLNNFAIHPLFRQKGLGMKLLQHIFEKFKDHREIFLEVRVSNVSAINLYIKTGFKERTRRKKYYPNGEDAIVMVKKLDEGK